jgi:hypothetical protein
VEAAKRVARCQWLTPVILVTQEAEIRKIEVQREGRREEKEGSAPKERKRNQPLCRIGFSLEPPACFLMEAPGWR